jgi:hypothetical protein
MPDLIYNNDSNLIWWDYFGQRMGKKIQIDRESTNTFRFRFSEEVAQLKDLILLNTENKFEV